MTEFLLALILALAQPVAAGETVLRSGPTRTRLVELYSSEGCSSCPPADEWVSSLLESSGLWRNFVPAVFHVTYWDYLGWKDRFGDPAFDARQRAYAAGWKSRGTYTPGVVLDGEEWRGWGGEPPPSNAPAGTLIAAVRGADVSVKFAPAADAGPYDVYAARLGFGLASDVAAGENAGRRLRHEFVVRGFARAAMKKANGAWRASLPLPAATGAKPAREGAAVWVVGADGRPVQAAGSILP